MIKWRYATASNYGLGVSPLHSMLCACDGWCEVYTNTDSTKRHLFAVGKIPTYSHPGNFDPQRRKKCMCETLNVFLK